MTSLLQRRAPACATWHARVASQLEADSFRARRDVPSRRDEMETASSRAADALVLRWCYLCVDLMFIKDLICYKQLHLFKHFISYFSFGLL